MPGKIFFHGVPDSPVIWSPVLDALNLDPTTVLTPGLPGFQSPPSDEFSKTKDDYASWAVDIVRTHFAQHGPVDIVGHDWGAIITHRVSMLVPEMIRSWVISSALVSPDYYGHRIARIWNTPILGELFMMMSTSDSIKRTLMNEGVPDWIAQNEAMHWKKPHMRSSILSLYRSADGLRFQDDWCHDLDNSPKAALLIWGQGDPYVPVQVAKKFAEDRELGLRIIPEAGHFALVEKPHAFADHLTEFWNSLP